MRHRRRITINPWALARPVCWLLGHDDRVVLGMRWADRTGSECVRCLKWVRR